MSEERLQKILARAGIASRRKAEEMIEQGLVTVNGEVAGSATRPIPSATRSRSRAGGCCRSTGRTTTSCSTSPRG